jgi:hypothetical protein
MSSDGKYKGGLPSAGRWVGLPSDGVWRARRSSAGKWARWRDPDGSLLILDFDDSGLHLATLGLTINGQTVYPQIRVLGKNAASGVWSAVGGNLSLVENGEDTTDDQLTALASERGVQGPAASVGHSGDYYEADDPTDFDLGTDDHVFVAVAWPQSTASPVAAEISPSKFKLGGSWPAGGIGYEHLITNTPGIYWRSADGVTTYKDTAITGTTLAGLMNWFAAAVDKSEASTVGAVAYLLNLATGAGTDFSALGSLSSPTDPLRIFTRGQGGASNYPFRGQAVAYLIWKKAAWLDAQTGVPEELLRIFHEALGMKARRGANPYPTTYSRASPACIELSEPNGTHRVITVNSGWAGRIVSPPGRTDRWLECEPAAATNLFQNSRRLDQAPNTVAATATMAADASAAPSGRLEADDVVEGSFSGSVAYFYQTKASTIGVRYCASGFVNNLHWGDRPYLRPTITDAPSRYFFFDQSGNITNVSGLAAGEYGVYYLGSGWWFYWLSAVMNTASVNITVPAYLTDVGTGGLYDSIPGQHAAAHWQYQFESTVKYPSSPIWTPSAASATRVAELLRYSAAGHITPGQGRIRIEAIVPPAAHTSASLLAISDGLSVNDYLELQISSTGLPRLNIQSTESGLTSITGTTNLRTTGGYFQPHVYDVSYRAGKALLIVDGVVEAEGAPASIPDDIDTISIGHNVASSGARCWVRRFQTFERAAA